MAHRVFGFIPARKASQRYPNKVMADLLGQPLVVHTYQRVSACLGPENCAILVDHIDNYQALRRYTDRVYLTSSDHRNGSERCAEGVSQLQLQEDSIVLNIQADEPLVSLHHIEALVAPFTNVVRPEFVTTLIYEWPEDVTIDSQHRVKAVVKASGQCRGFYRQLPARLKHETDSVYLHGGFYGYSARMLLNYAKWSEDRQEAELHLEQLRFLKHGIPILGCLCEHPTQSVDVPQDLSRVKEHLLQIK